jgi:hypothetical protein
MYEGWDLIFRGHGILKPLILTVETNKGQCLTTIIYSESPHLRCMGEDVWCKTNTLPILMHQMHISTTQVSSVMLRYFKAMHILNPFPLTKKTSRGSMFHNHNILNQYFESIFHGHNILNPLFLIMETNRVNVSPPLYSESHHILCHYSNKKITKFVLAVIS